jgi:Fe-S-cluster containining protein
MIEKAVEIYKNLGISSNTERRELLVNSMKSLKSDGVNCQSCTGLCCTFVSNSMQTDPIQTLELYIYLQNENMWNDQLVEELGEVVKNNRLDYEISTGARSSFRRTYTCPFYNKGPKGCSISPESKPYGCLAFNAKAKDTKEGENCSLNTEFLIERDNKYSQIEQAANDSLKKLFGLDWDKLPMPVALLNLHQKICQ